MRKRGYDDGFSASIAAAAGTIGVIIPPSVPLVLIGSIMGASVSRILLAGLVPGIVMGLALMIYIGIVSKKRNYPRAEAFTFPNFFRAMWKALPAIGAMLVVVGSVLLAIPICPSGPISNRFNIKFVINTTALYFTGVLVSPLAKKLGIKAFTIT